MITKNYIKQCEEAKEIQKAWKPKDWDRFIYKDDRELGIACVDEEPMNKKTMREINKKYIYIPTQEQLQEMISCNWYNVFCKFLWWHWDDDKNSEKFESMFTSMNEVWLAFVMKEKYNKKWRDGKWN